MYRFLFMLSLLLVLGCGRRVAELDELHHEKIIYGNDEKFDGIEVAQNYLESITSPLLSQEFGAKERTFFEIWTAFGQKCDLWTYVTRYSRDFGSTEQAFVVSLSAKREGQPDDDSGNLGERMLGSGGILRVPITKAGGKVVFDRRARLPGHPKYNKVLEYQRLIEVFISDIDYCFHDYK